MQPMEYANSTEYTGSAGTSRLAELGLTPEDLEYALRGADAEARTWSPSAPPVMPGLARWAKTNELLRLRLLPRGWTQDNPHLLPRTISPDRTHAIVATAGDAATGLPHANPSTRYAKGNETVKAVEANIQLAFDFAGLFNWPAPSDHGTPEPALGTWLLLYNPAETEIRAELSLASAISATGFVGAWRERIILPVIDLTSPDAAGRGRGTESGATVAVGQR
jgi:hypothetical protein